MKRRVSLILLPLIITLACVMSVGGFYSVKEGGLFTPGEKNTSVTRPSEQQQAATNESKRTGEEYGQIVLKRNLFGPPPSVAQGLSSESKAPADVQPTSLSLVLMGTIVSEGEESRAIILEKDQKRQAIYHLGEAVQGAVLKEIARGKVVLTYNNREEILDMSEAAKHSAQTPASDPIAATSAMQQDQIPPGSDSQMLEVSEPSSDSTPPGVQLKALRLHRRAYAPSRSIPANG